MITELVTRVCDTVELAQQLTVNRNERKAMEATRKELEKLAESARALSAALQICRARLGDEDLMPVMAQMSQLAQAVDASRRRFATARSEYESIDTLNQHLQALRTVFTKQWRAYAQKRLAPYQELSKLVGYLPEIAASQADINQLFEQLKRQSDSPPQNEAQLAQFDQHLASLEQLLGGVRLLPEEVRAFLGKVIGGSATVADITPEVSAWIAEGRRAASFAVSFRASRSQSS